MTIGVLRLRLLIRGSRSLKEKRRHIKGLKDRITGKFRAACAEVGRQDSRQHAELGVAVVSGDGRHASEMLFSILEMVRLHRELEVVEHETELL